MRFQDIMRTGVWQKQCKYFVNEVGKKEEAPHGYCQVLTVTDTVGIKEPLNYFFDGDEMEIEVDFVGEQWLDVRWKKDQKYFQCIPAQPPKEQNWTDDDKPDWNKIALGKCRHGILCAYIKSGKFFDANTRISKARLSLINELAEFSMTGEINDEKSN